MKSTLFILIVSTLASLNIASAAQQITNTTGKEKIGVVSAGNALSLDELTGELSLKADARGATSFKYYQPQGIIKCTGLQKFTGSHTCLFGFESQQIFTRVFTKRYKTPPARYRNMNKH